LAARLFVADDDDDDDDDADADADAPAFLDDDDATGVLMAEDGVESVYCRMSRAPEGGDHEGWSGVEVLTFEVVMDRFPDAF
jgi:hypothetical protein